MRRLDREPEIIAMAGALQLGVDYLKKPDASEVDDME